MTTFGARLRGVDSVWGRNLPFSTDKPSRRQRTTASTAVLTMSLPFSLEAVLRTGGGVLSGSPDSTCNWPRGNPPAAADINFHGRVDASAARSTLIGPQRVTSSGAPASGRQ